MGEEIGKALTSEETSFIAILHLRASFCRWLREMEDSEDEDTSEIHGEFLVTSHTLDGIGSNIILR